MNESIWMYFFMILGILGIILINIFGNIVVSNEQNYYALKETTESAMIDAIDWDTVRVGLDQETIDKVNRTFPGSMHCEAGVKGTYRIVTEKFVESFVRRFSQSANLNRQYRIVIHEIDECPPKVAITLIATERFAYVGFFDVHYNSETGEDPTQADIKNSIVGILEETPPLAN